MNMLVPALAAVRQFGAGPLVYRCGLSRQEVNRRAYEMEKSIEALLSASDSPMSFAAIWRRMPLDVGHRRLRHGLLRLCRRGVIEKSSPSKRRTTYRLRSER